MQWHQLDHMQTICTSLQTDNHAYTSSLNFFIGRMLFLAPNQQRQSSEGSEGSGTELYYMHVCLQCFDAVGWAAGRASGL